MARPRRLRISGVSQHVIQRGNNRSDIFRREDDYELLLLMLRDAAKRHSVDIHGYVLMKNHVHVLATGKLPTAVERTMHLVGCRYALYFNKRHHRTGALFEGRYRATYVDHDEYWYTCLRYIELNPVRAGIVKQPDGYPWSSYAANALGSPDRLLTPHRLYLDLGNSDTERQNRWRTMCADDIDPEELHRLRFAVHQGRAFGNVVLRAKEGEL